MSVNITGLLISIGNHHRNLIGEYIGRLRVGVELPNGDDADVDGVLGGDVEGENVLGILNGVMGCAGETLDILDDVGVFDEEGVEGVEREGKPRILAPYKSQSSSSAIIS